MAVKIISIVVVLIIHIVLAIVAIGMMLLAMNGYNDAAAEAAIKWYSIAQFFFVLISAVVTFVLVLLFQNKLQWSPAISSLVSIAIALVIVFLMTGIAIGIGIGAGDVVFRQAYPR